MFTKNISFLSMIVVLFYQRIPTLICSESKKEGKDQKSIQSSTTPDPGYQWESDNITLRHHKREPKGQPFPSRTNKQMCMKA